MSGVAPPFNNNYNQYGNNDSQGWNLFNTSYSSIPYNPQWPNTINPTISFGIAVAYIFVLGFMAIVMCYRSRTRLRVAVCLFTYLDLSTAIIGLFWTLPRFHINGMWYWSWKLLAESLGMLSLSYTLLTVGNGFYPMAEKRRLCWTITVALLVTYGLMSIGILTYYVQQKLVYHALSASNMTDLWLTAVSDEVAWPHHRYDYGNYSYMGYFGGCTDNVQGGVDNWVQMKLCFAVLEVYSRPNFWIYVAYQLVMIITCTWTSFYLFMPLVKSFQAVARPTENHTKTIGYWYLTWLEAIMLVYCGLNIFLCFHHWLAYTPQIQALEICIRATISPILSLPAPPLLLRVFSKNTKHCVLGNNSLIPGGSKDGGDRGNSSFRGSFVIEEQGAKTSAPQSPVGPPASFNFGSGVDRQDSVGSSYSRANLFQSKGRGSTDSYNRPSRDYKREYYHGNNRDIELDSQPVMGNFNNEIIYTTPFRDTSAKSTYEDSSIQRPEPALTSNTLNDVVRSTTVSETTVNIPFASDSETMHVSNEIVDSTPVTGSTGWEIGGWEHARQSSDGNNIVLSSPLEEYFPSSPKLARSTPTVNTDLNSKTGSDSSPSPKKPDFTAISFDSNGVELTGLRKQLAEYHSSLLPAVIAIQEQDDDLDPATETSGGNYNTDTADQDARRYRPKGLGKRFPDATIGPVHSSYKESSASQPADGSTAEMSSAPTMKPLNWSNLTATTLSTHSSDDNSTSQAAISSSKVPEKSGTGFRKWLPGRKQNDDDYKDPSQSAPNTSSEDAKIAKRNSFTGLNEHASKNSKPKEPRRGVFSKVLGGDRGRLSHDIVDQDRDTKTLDSEGKPQNGPASASAPATVEALALESTKSTFDLKDDEKGLQYYYPDPYHSFTEFAKPQSSTRDQTVTVKRSTSMSSQRHPLSTIFSDDEIAENESTYAGLNPSISDNLSSNASASRISLPLSLKSGKSSKKPSKKDIAMMYYQESSNIDGGSIRSNSTTKSSEQGSTKGSKHRKSDPKTLAVSPPVQTSLSPPPRQNWARSRSFQGGNQSLPSLKLETSIKIDTKLANEGSGPKTGQSSDVDPDSSGVRTSLSSSLGSPTSVSPNLSPSGRRVEADGLAFEASPPISPIPTALGIARLGGHKTRVSNDYRTHSLDRDGEYSANLENRVGFSTAAMDLRRAHNKHQRSVDNLASSYYYRRGTDGEPSQKGKSSLEYLAPGMPTSASSPSLPNANEVVTPVDSGRSSSFTNSLRYMADDDQWTQSMVARAKKNGSKSESEDQHPGVPRQSRRHLTSGRTPSPISPTSESFSGQRSKSGAPQGQSGDSGARANINIPDLSEYYTRRPSINRSGSE